MKEENSFPAWFKNTLIGIGVYSVLVIVFKYFERYVPFIALGFPIVLYFIRLFESVPESWQPDRAKHFTNISFSIIGFLSLVQMLKYDYYIEHAGKLIIGGNEIFLAEDYYARISIYIFTLLFLIILGSYLTLKTAKRIKSFDGISAFQDGKKIWRDLLVAISNGKNLEPFRTPEYKERQKKEALRLFDIAIEKGYKNAEVFSLRASCLNDLGFYFDAIKDYDEAISKNPPHGTASNYHMRSLIKDTIFDYRGSLADIEEAIRLSKLDNDDNKYWNEYAKTTGYETATQFYEWQREMVKVRLEFEETNPKDRTTELKFIKRRNQ